MFYYFYLFAAVAGWLLVGVSIASGAGSGGDGDAGGGEAGTGHALGDGQPEHLVHSDGQVAHGPLPSGGGHGSLLSNLGGAALFFFSLQFWTYLLAFGGLTGLLLRTLAHAGEPVSGICALGVGVTTATAARKVLRRLSNTVDSGTVEQSELIGTSAKVLIPAEPGTTGKVRLVARGQTIDLLARAHDGGPLREGAEVIILDISLQDGIAEVTPEVDEKELALNGRTAAGSTAALKAGARAALPQAAPSMQSRSKPSG